MTVYSMPAVPHADTDIEYARMLAPVLSRLFNPVFAKPTTGNVYARTELENIRNEIHRKDYS